MLESLGLNNLWINQDTYDISLPIIKQRLFDQYYQSWYNKINTPHRLESYCRFKHNFNVEPYLDIISDNKYKIALSRFRLSSHKLEIERGRYHNIPRIERKCKLCSLNTIEDEYHFLLLCPKYYELRRKVLTPYYCRWPNLNKFDQLLSTINKTEILNLAKFIYFSTKLRNESDI